MRKVSNLLLVGIVVAGLTTGCKKKGCTDLNANNYNMEAGKDDGSCTYPTVNITNANGGGGDVTGNGGTATNTHTWENNLSRAELNFDITSSKGGSMQVIVKDADGAEVINSTLTVGVGDDSKTICSSAGTSGTWTVEITLTDFNGDGSFTLDQGC